MTKSNQHPENPHPAGTFLAAQWDFNHALRNLAKESRKAAREDARRIRKFLKQVRRP